jgi:hypothetical protein
MADRHCAHTVHPLELQFMQAAVRSIACLFSCESAGSRFRFIPTRTNPAAMTSRLTAVAFSFAVLATASLAFAKGSHVHASATHATAAQTQVVQLERVVVTAKRLTAVSR